MPRYRYCRGAGRRHGLGIVQEAYNVCESEKASAHVMGSWSSPHVGVTSRHRTSFGTAMVGLLKRRHPGTAEHDCVRVCAEKPQLEFRTM